MEMIEECFIVTEMAQGVPNLGKGDKRRVHAEENRFKFMGFPRGFGNISSRFRFKVFESDSGDKTNACVL